MRFFAENLKFFKRGFEFGGFMFIIISISWYRIFISLLVSCENENIEVVFDSLVLFSILDDRESGEPSKRKSYLPSEKQFLITRNGKIMDFWLLFMLWWVIECSLLMLFFVIIVVLGILIHLLEVSLKKIKDLRVIFTLLSVHCFCYFLL